MRKNQKVKDQKDLKIKEYLKKIHKSLSGATSSELFKTMNDLAENPELRKRCEKEMNDSLPKGYSFSINSCGIGRLMCPLHITSIRNNKDK